MTVKSSAAVRFDQRWDDYCCVLQNGTDPAVGLSEPRPEDVRDEVREVLGGPERKQAYEAAQERHRRREMTAVEFEAATEAYYSPRVSAAQLDAANALLETVWKEDLPRWPLRLESFLEVLSKEGREIFADLVKRGCQPDRLALRFQEAADHERRGTEQHQHVRDELDELEQLGTAARRALAAFLKCRRRFDEYLVRERLRSMADPEVERLAIVGEELEQVLASQRQDLRSVRRQTDGRRQLFLNHPSIRLSQQVHQSIGHYLDRKVAFVLSDLMEARGQDPVGLDTLKKRRSQWKKQRFQGN